MGVAFGSRRHTAAPRGLGAPRRRARRQFGRKEFRGDPSGSANEHPDEGRGSRSAARAARFPPAYAVDNTGPRGSCRAPPRTRTAMTELTPPRLRLRHWREADLAPFAALNADPVTMEFLGPCLSRGESDALAQRAEDGL